MLCIQNNEINPYFNIASEEYLLKEFEEEIFMLYRNSPSVIVGKHQNAMAEINHTYVREKNIDVVRRISGGGTVYHDLGNLNFTFIKNIEKGENLVDFKEHTRPIVEAFKILGIKVRLERKSNLTINGVKISGNAEHVYKRRVLHHGTILFSSNLEDLTKAIKTDPEKYTDKGVESIRVEVTNVVDHLHHQMDIQTFTNTIFDLISRSNKDTVFYKFSESDILSINDLVIEKYVTWEWNFGYGPKYDFQNIMILKNQPVQINLTVQNGMIQTVSIGESVFFKGVHKKIISALTGIKHREKEIEETLKLFELEKQLDALTFKALVNSFF